MTKKSKTTKKALVLSAGSLMLSCAMLVGTTFAWFTDTVNTSRNRIVAGNLDVELEYWAPKGELETQKEKTWNPVNEDTNLFDNLLWEPGKMYTYTFRVSNAGNLALQYEFNLQKLAENALKESNAVDKNGKQHSLSEVIKVAFLDVALTKATDENGTFNAADAKPTKLPDDGKQGDAARKAYLDKIEPYPTTNPGNTKEEEESKDYEATFEDLNTASKKGKLLPMPEVKDGQVVEPADDKDNNEHIANKDFFNNGEEGTERTNNWCDAFTMVLYWAPNSGDVDNLYNVNNDKETDDGGNLLVSATPAPGYSMDPKNENPTDALFIDLGINLFATQVEYEKDSFDEKYDKIVEVSNAADLKDTLDALQNEEADNVEIVIGSNIDVPDGKTRFTVPTGKNVTLDFEGHTLSHGDYTGGEDENIGCPAVWNNGGTLTIKNAIIKSEETSSKNGHSPAVSSQGGTLVLENCTLSNKGGAANYCVTAEKADVTLRNCKITDDTANGGVWVSDCNLTIEGGTINSKHHYSLYVANSTSGKKVVCDGVTFKRTGCDNCRNAFLYYVGEETNADFTFKNCKFEGCDVGGKKTAFAITAQKSDQGVTEMKFEPAKDKFTFENCTKKNCCDCGQNCWPTTGVDPEE